MANNLFNRTFTILDHLLDVLRNLLHLENHNSCVPFLCFKLFSSCNHVEFNFYNTSYVLIFDIVLKRM